MTIKTLKDVTDTAYDNAHEVLDQLILDLSVTGEDIEQELRDKVESNGYSEPEVIYYHEAWDIVGGSSFNTIDIDTPDFSQCETALDCVMLEAQMIVSAAYSEYEGDGIAELAGELAEFIDEALEMGAPDELDIKISSSCLFGWMPHNRETESGACIYDDKPGFYNPEKVEGELYAIEKKVGSYHVSVCWNPEDYEECAA